ncbi:protoheme IX farnesyltransferase [Malonomonas rubra]|uniref:protoheme IX farnesyltransferase n=1 Tax=Malonomonas rubra TaxID=57040 RepID=UPI0026F0899E|nr:UbiA family prenyltransferase [Malonomonas rubra]
MNERSEHNGHPRPNNGAVEVCLPPNSSAWYKLNLLRQLSRAELSGMVAFSALTGNLLAVQSWPFAALVSTLSVLLLAGGCSALNQWQEQDLDARMERTCCRPLPAGELAPRSVLSFAGSSILAGLLLLTLVPGKLALLLGLLAVIWYNGIYTPLKRHTPFAAVPGALCGALPPLIGWAAGGGQPWEAKILLLAGTLFLWQIPHSWLLLCRYRDDLRQSGLPNLFEAIPTDRLLRINNCWLLALGLCYLQFPLFGYIANSLLASLFLATCTAIFLAVLTETRKPSRLASSLRLFHLTNFSMTLLLVVLQLDTLLG